MATVDEELRIRVLGGVELSLSGRPLVGLASAKGTALLVYLAVTGRAHSRSALAGLLWSDLPEQTARANLRLVLTKLRRILPHHVTATRTTVTLAEDRPVWVDAVEVGRAARAGSNGAGGTDLLPTVRLCRGELLDGFAVPGAELFDEWLAGRRAAARADMLALLERAAQRAREQGATEAGIEAARRMVGLEPLREEAHRALMWFLATAGQRSAALAQYDTCCYLLREELGVEPSALTASLAADIAGAGGFTDLAAPATSTAGDDLPRPLTALVGRERELARLHSMLDDAACRLVTLVGPGGIGKTRLAVEVAASRRSRASDDVVFASFVGTAPARPGDAADLVVAHLARTLGLAPSAPGDLLELIAEQLTGRRRLLVLDNLEHLRGAAAVFSELLRRVPDLQLLVTSRRQLGLGAEWVFEVRGLAFPRPGDERAASGYPAVELFEERARLVRPGSLGVGGSDGVARVCRLVDGVPLAIELAARWVRGADPDAIADRLGRGLELLSTEAPDVEQRHRSLRAVIDWSHQLLTDAESRALHRLSVFRGGFDLDAAEAVAGADLPILGGLVEQSLVVVAEDGRYDMHELLRQYAGERLAAEPEQERAVRRRHAAHFAARLPEVGADDENLHVATDWFVRCGDPAALDSHLMRVWALYRNQGRFREVQAFVRAALRRDDVPSALVARWQRVLGECAQQLGQAAAARHHLERALAASGTRLPSSHAGWANALARAVSDRAVHRLRPDRVARDAHTRELATERAAALFAICEAYWTLEGPLPVLVSSLRALDDAERAGDADLVARAEAGVGMTVGTARFRRSGGRSLRAARAAAERSDDPLTACWVGILGGLYGLGVGDWSAVESGGARALELQRGAPLHRLADQNGLIVAIAQYLRGRYPEAVTGATRGLTAGRQRHDPGVQLWALLILLETNLRTDPDAAALAAWGAEASRLLPKATAVDAARLHVATARRQLHCGETSAAIRELRIADGLADAPSPSVPYALEAHAGMLDVCLTLIDHGAPAELRAMAAAAHRRLRRHARTFPVARPRALLGVGRLAESGGRSRTARRAWVRAAAEAERLGMPYEVAGAHDALGRHLGGEARSALGLTRTQHLNRALADYEAIGCAADARRLRAILAEDAGAR
ncbi:ATP-binding protein [Cryptosporangium minutisporangium]|uniref:ATP-binding protein n=1 Tax=Cryptosporangium minutisporangium TaxID=113569 RepID=UPI0031F1527E